MLVPLVFLSFSHIHMLCLVSRTPLHVTQTMVDVISKFSIRKQSNCFLFLEFISKDASSLSVSVL
jgi:hypothetical protein